MIYVSLAAIMAITGFMAIYLAPVRRIEINRSTLIILMLFIYVLASIVFSVVLYREINE